THSRGSLGSGGRLKHGAAQCPGSEAAALKSHRSKKTARCSTGSISDCGSRDTPCICRYHAVNAMVDRHDGRDTGRIRAAGWGTDVHPRLRVGNAVGDPGADVSGGALMLQLTPQSRIFLAVEPIDFRAGIDRLAAFCRERLAQNPLGGAVYVLRNRRSTALKVLFYDGQGFWLCTKRLSQGRFQWWPRTQTTAWRLSARELPILLWNGHPQAAHMAEDWRQVA